MGVYFQIIGFNRLQTDIIGYNRPCNIPGYLRKYHRPPGTAPGTVPHRMFPRGGPRKPVTPNGDPEVVRKPLPLRTPARGLPQNPPPGREAGRSAPRQTGERDPGPPSRLERGDPRPGPIRAGNPRGAMPPAPASGGGRSRKPARAGSPGPVTAGNP